MPREAPSPAPPDAPTRPVADGAATELGRRDLAWIGGALLLLLLAAHGRTIVGGETFVLHDHLIYTLPSRAHLVDALTHGRLPEWWSGIGLGAPFAANANHGALYPPAWLAALFSPSVGADVVLLLHLFWLGLGGALLAARLAAGRIGALLAGGLLMTSGFATSIAVNALPPITFAWTPWVAWAAVGLARAPDRRGTWRAVGVVALCAAMQLSSGEPAGVITSLLLATLSTLVIARRRLLAVACLVGATAFALLLAAFALVPAVGLLLETNRAGGLALSDAGAWSLHPLRLLELFWPRVLGAPSDATLHLARAVAHSGGPGLDPSWALSFYTGAPTLLLAFWAMRVRAPHARALAWCSLALLLIALGTYTPAYQLFRALFLPERLVRYPERHFAGALVLWTTLAGMGWGRVLAGAGHARGPGRVFAASAAGLGALALLLLACSGRLAAGISALGPTLTPRLDGAAVAATMIEGGVLAAAVLAAVWLCLYLRTCGRERLAVASASVVMLAGLVVEAWWLHPLLPRAVIDGRPALLAPLASVPSPEAPRPRLYRRPGLVPGLVLPGLVPETSGEPGPGLPGRLVPETSAPPGLVPETSAPEPSAGLVPRRLLLVPETSRRELLVPETSRRVPETSRRETPRRLVPETSGTGASLAALGLHHTVWENIGARFGVEHFPGWDPAQPAGLVTLWAAAVRTGLGLRALDLYGVEYAILRASEVGGPLQPLAATPKGDVVLARNREHRPRAFVAPRWRALGSKAEVLDVLFAPALDRGEVRLAAPLQGASPAGGNAGEAPIAPCSLTSTRPERIRLDCEAAFPGYAVLLDAYWPGWYATVDGLPVPIERADLIVRAVPVSAGHHVVEMTYRTPGLRAGFWLALPAWLVLAVLFVLTRRRHRQVRFSLPVSCSS